LSLGERGDPLRLQQLADSLRVQDLLQCGQKWLAAFTPLLPTRNVIRSHYGHGFAKQYVRDDRLLRTEPATNNVYDYGVNKDVENLPALRDRMSAIIDNYHDVQQDILETFIDRGQLRKLAKPTILPGGRRIPGPKLDHPRLPAA
jgi:hypothetical protein